MTDWLILWVGVLGFGALLCWVAHHFDYYDLEFQIEWEGGNFAIFAFCVFAAGLLGTLGWLVVWGFG